LLEFLEERAKTRGCARFVLETGYLQAEALSLYLRSGYVRCPAFAPYSDDPNSVFMARPQTNPTAPGRSAPRERCSLNRQV
jgi:putative acetyltransferase